MSSINKFLGLSIRGDLLSYSLIYKESLLNLGSIDVKYNSKDYFSKINSVFSLIKSEVLKQNNVSQDSTSDCSWSVGIYHDKVPNRHNFDRNKFYRLCRLKTIVECSCSLTLNTIPLIISDIDICKTIGKISDKKISTIEDVINYATNKLSNFIKGQSSIQLGGIATSWATALTLKRRISLESLVLGDEDTIKIQDRLFKDKIVNELVVSINNRKEDKEELKNVLKKRIHKLVEDYVESLV